MMLKSLRDYFYLLPIIFYSSWLSASCYRTATFLTPDFSIYKLPKEKLETWISASISRGTTSTGFDQSGDYGPLFCGFGATTFDQFARNYPYLKKWPKTADFIKTVCLNSNFDSNEKSLICGGDLEIVDLNLLFCVPVGENFSAFCELPLKMTKMKGLKFVTNSGGESEFAKLVNSKIDDVLGEHGFEKFSSDPVLSGISDIAIMFGWADKHTNNDLKIAVAGVGASIRGGFIIPSSTISGSNKKFLYNIPLGENGSFGVKLQAECEIEFRPYICLVGSIDSRIYMRKNELLKTKIVKEQQGLFLDPMASVTYDNGHFFKFGAAVKMGSPRVGLFVSGGYTYSSKEVSQLSLADSEYLKRQKRQIIKNAELPGITSSNVDTVVADNKCDEVYLSNSVINLDNQLVRQYLHCVHVSFAFQPSMSEKYENFLDGPDPAIEISYNYPLYGKSYIAMPFIAGNMAFGFKIKF